MDIQSMNLVNQTTHETPSYPLDGKETSIGLAFNTEGDLLILGVVDNNYVHWISLTKTDNRKANEAVFNHIANRPYHFVASTTTALRLAGLSFAGYRQWYHTDLKRAHDTGHAWKTPFGYYYGTKTIEEHGRYFAADVDAYRGTLLKRCRFREANGAYENVLDYCLEELSKEKSAAHYATVKELIAMVEQESYILVSPNAAIREKYLLVQEKASGLYNQYMNEMR